MHDCDTEAPQLGSQSGCSTSQAGLQAETGVIPKRHKFPLQPILPLTRGEHLYEALYEKCNPPPPHERPFNAWISGGM